MARDSAAETERRTPQCRVIVGAIGGSGTRAVTQILRRGGVFLGDPLTSVGESLPILEFHNRWVSAFLTGQSCGPSFLATLEKEMRRDLLATVEMHLARLEDCASPWGWKQPRSIFLLPFLDRVYPTMKFVHVVRDGRDMAFSDNRNVLNLYGINLLTREERNLRAPRRAIRIWSRANLAAEAYCRAHMPSRYMLLRFEDLCDRPRESVERLFEFLALDGDCERIARDEIRPPKSRGRFQRRRSAKGLLTRVRSAVRDWIADEPELARVVERDGADGLRAFEYSAR